MRIEERYLIELINAVLNNRKCDNPPKQFNFEYLVQLSRAHSVDNLVYYAITRNNLKFPQSIFEAIKAGFRDHSFRYASNSAELEYVEKMFDDNGIEYILLKGSIIRNLYPNPDMRTSCDVDLLCKKEDAKKIEKLMVSSGFEYTNEADAVDSYKKFPFVSFEIHKELMGNRERFDCVKNPWGNSVPLENTKCGKQLSLEDFYLYMIAHTVKHFSSGGCGIRAIMDIYIFLKQYNDTLNWEYINSVLSEYSLFKFSSELILISKIWFSGETADEFSDELSSFIINSGTFGTKTTADVQDEIYKRNGKVIVKTPSLLKVVFLSYKNMFRRYPVLNKAPYLLPIYWVIRIIDVIINKQDKVRKTFAYKPQFDENKISKVNNLLENLEII